MGFSVTDEIGDFVVSQEGSREDLRRRESAKMLDLWCKQFPADRLELSDRLRR